MSKLFKRSLIIGVFVGILSSASLLICLLNSHGFDVLRCVIFAPWAVVFIFFTPPNSYVLAFLNLITTTLIFFMVSYLLGMLFLAIKKLFKRH